jgi:hypothetical protein
MQLLLFAAVAPISMRADAGESNVLVVHSPKSGVNFFNLGDFEGQMNTALERSLISISKAQRRKASSGSTTLQTA